MLTFILNLALAYLFLFPVIFLHEWGHATVAKLFNFKVFSMTIGYGRKLFESNIFGVPLTVNLIPVQGVTVAMPKTEIFYKTRVWCYVWGGLLMQIALVLACFLILGEQGFGEAVHPKSIFTEFAPLTAFIYANAFLFLINIFPQKIATPAGNLYTDGYHLLTLPFQKTVKLDDIDTTLLAMEAIELSRLGKYDEAIEIYESLLPKKPDNFVFGLHIATIKLSKGEVEAGRNLFAEILRRIEDEKQGDKNYEPLKFILYNNIAWTNVIYHDENLLEQAERYSALALESSPKYAVFLGTRGAVLIRKGRIREGIELLKKAYKYHSEPAARSAEAAFIGIGEAKSGNENEAVRWLEKARAIDSNVHFLSVAEKEIEEELNKIRSYD